MQVEKITSGSTSQMIDVFIYDSTVTTGAGKTGLVFNTASLVGSYRKGATGARTAITLATQTVAGAFSSGGFVEIDATNMPGWYRLDLVDASIDTAGRTYINLKGATGMVPCNIRVDLMPSSANVAQLLGTAWLTPAVAGTPDVNTKTILDGAITAAKIAADAITDAKVAADVTIASVTGAVGSVTADVGITQAGADKAWSSATRALTDKVGFALSAAGIQAIWDAATTALTTVGSLGKLLVDNINATISSRSSHTAANVATEVLVTPANKIANATGGKVTVGTNDDKTGYTASTVSDKTGYSLSAAGIQAVWDALSTALTTVGSIGKRIVDYLNASVSGVTAPTAAAVADAVWDEVSADHVTAGTTGKKLSDAAAAAADPLLNTVPGSYASGTAGNALGRIGSGQITTVSPVAQSGDVNIRRGDDYNDTDARALDWTDTSAAWPTLTGATVSFKIVKPDGTTHFSKAGSVVTATGASKKVRVELTSANTTSLTAGTYRFEMEATISSRIITLVSGNLTVEANT